MNRVFLFGVILSLLLIETIQQSTVANPNPLNKFNDALKRSLQEKQENEVEMLMDKKLKSQIFIWTSIGLAVVCYFSVMAIIDMSNPKSSILYAKYDTTRGGNEI